MSENPKDVPQSGYDGYDARQPSPPALGNPDWVPGSKHKATEGHTN